MVMGQQQNEWHDCTCSGCMRVARRDHMVSKLHVVLECRKCTAVGHGVSPLRCLCEGVFLHALTVALMWANVCNLIILIPLHPTRCQILAVLTECPLWRLTPLYAWLS